MRCGSDRAYDAGRPIVLPVAAQSSDRRDPVRLTQGWLKRAAVCVVAYNFR